MGFWKEYQKNVNGYPYKEVGDEDEEESGMSFGGLGGLQGMADWQSDFGSVGKATSEENIKLGISQQKPEGPLSEQQQQLAQHQYNPEDPAPVVGAAQDGYFAGADIQGTGQLSPELLASIQGAASGQGFAGSRLAQEAAQDKAAQSLRAGSLTGTRGMSPQAIKAAEQAGLAQLGSEAAATRAQIASQEQQAAIGLQAQVEEGQISREDAVNIVRSEYAQAAGLTEDQLQQQTDEFNAGLKAQIDVERDKRINELIGYGVEYNTAVMQTLISITFHHPQNRK